MAAASDGSQTKWLGVLVALLVTSAAPASQEPAMPWQTTWMDLEITLLPDQGTLEIDGSLLVEILVPGVSEIPLRMNSRAATMSFLEVGSPEGDGEIPARRLGSGNIREALVRFETPREIGDEVELWFRSSNQGRQSSQFAVTKDLALASWVEAWHPIAVPPQVTGSASLGSTPGTTKFNLPTGWRALSNGLRIEHSDAGEVASEVWEVGQPVARSFAAGPYQVASHEVGERTVDVYRLSGDPEQAQHQAQGLARALAALETRFGPYPYPSCHLAEVPNSRFGWAASSEQGFVMANEWVFQFGQNLGIFAHEASHGWWGNLVNSRGSGSIFCSETLSQYGAVLAIEILEGEQAATDFLQFSRPGAVQAQCARGYFEIARNGQDIALSALRGQSSAHNLSDSKGPWVLHMLRRRVGDEVFFETIRGILKDFAGKRVSLDDVRSRFHEAAPESSLDTFFPQWLDRTGAPHLTATWKGVPGDSSNGELVIQQFGEPYELWLDLELRGERTTNRHSVKVDSPRTVLRLPAEEPVQSVVLDPDHRLLMWRPEYGSPLRALPEAPPASR